MNIMKEFLENDIQVFTGVGEKTKYMHEVRRPVQRRWPHSLKFSDSIQFLQNFCAFM